MSKSMFQSIGLYCALSLGAGSVYVLSCAPGLLWQDSGVIQYRVWAGDVKGTLGLALSHPLFYILAAGAKGVPLGSVSYRVNLVSAAAGAITVGNLGLLIRLYNGRVVAAVVGAIALAIGHTFWWHACVAETYTLWAALFTVELIVLLRYDRTRDVRYLYVLALLNGMAMAVHVMACVPLVCYVVLVVTVVMRKKVSPKAVALMAAAWLVGAAPLGYLVIEQIASTGKVLNTLNSLAFGDRWQGDVLNLTLSWRMVKENGLLMLLNCPGPQLVLVFIGIGVLWKRRASGLWPATILALMLLFGLFAFRYTVSDRYAFFIPFYVMAAICLGLGADAVLARAQGKWPIILMCLCLLLPVAVYAVVPRIARHMNVSLGTRGDVPYRDDYKYFLQPWKRGYRGAERFADEALELVEADAVIYADSTTVGPLLYTHDAYGRRSDVDIVTGVVNHDDALGHDAGTFERLILSRPIYVTSNQRGYCPSFILDGPYELVRDRVLWRVSIR